MINRLRCLGPEVGDPIEWTVATATASVLAVSQVSMQLMGVNFKWSDNSISSLPHRVAYVPLSCVSITEISRP